MTELSKLLGPFNLHIFELLIAESASVRELAKKAKCSPAKIIQFVDLYSKNRLISIEKNDNRKIIALDKSNPLVREIVTLIYTNKVLDSKAFSALKKASDSIGLYGSVIEGTVDKQSDIDLWIVSGSRKRITEAGKLRQEFSKEMGRDVSLKFFTPQDIKNLKEKDRIFYNELENKSKILHGDGF